MLQVMRCRALLEFVTAFLQSIYDARCQNGLAGQKYFKISRAPQGRFATYITELGLFLCHVAMA